MQTISTSFGLFRAHNIESRLFFMKTWIEKRAKMKKIPMQNAFRRRETLLASSKIHVPPGFSTSAALGGFVWPAASFLFTLCIYGPGAGDFGCRISLAQMAYRIRNARQRRRVGLAAVAGYKKESAGHSFPTVKTTLVIHQTSCFFQLLCIQTPSPAINSKGKK